jgi:spectrin beta
MAEQRKQRLLDALALYRLFNEADSVDQWITEKEKLLHTMVAKEDIEEVEILKARFDTFDQEMGANKDKVAIVSQLANQLVANEHPNSAEVVERERQLKDRWEALRGIADEKKDVLQLAHDVNTWHIEAQETATWIRDKEKLIESTDTLGNDLGGIITLQRRLSGLERDLAAIDARRATLHAEAQRLADAKPSEAEAIREKADAVDQLWLELKTMLTVREERLGEASELQKFLQDLDHFQQWLTRTQTAIASENIPADVAEAELMLSQHAQLRAEIDAYAPDYAKMKQYGETVVEGQQDVQYMFLRERLKALDDGWLDVGRMWENKLNILKANLNLQLFTRDARQAEILLSEQDNFLSKEEIPLEPGAARLTPEAAQNQIRQIESFISTMDANDEKINTVVRFADELVGTNHYASEKIRRKADSLVERRDANRRRANDKLNRLRDFLQLQTFFQDCDELADWIGEKMLAAQDETYRDAKNIHSKWMRHQAFESEIRSNKDQLEKLIRDGERIIAEKPDLAVVVQPKLDELSRQWKDLEDVTAAKGQRLFDANRGVLYEQSVDDIDGWIKEIESQIVTEDVGHDLTTVNLLMQKQNILESQLKMKEVQVKALENQAVLLREVDPDRELELASRKVEVEDRFQRLLAPLIERREKLDRFKRVRQFLRDVEDEKMWIAERLARARVANYGNSLLSVQMLLGKNRTLRNEYDSHEPTIIQVVDLGLSMIEEGHEQSDEFQEQIDKLNTAWSELNEAIDEQRARIELSEVAQQYFFDANECESWMSEQELYMISEERARDEAGAGNMLKKHANMEKTVEDYAEVVRQLGERARKLVDEKNPDGDAIGVKQAQVDKLYASLKDLVGDRRLKLDEILKLFMLNRDIEDLEQWIAEREVVAGSHELGQDFEHVTMLRDRFKEFARDTEAIGQERVAAVNEVCDRLINAGHSDAAVIAEWKDTINEMWTDLLELIDTRTQMLAASYELFKFYNDCRETLERIREKEVLIPDEIGRDAQSTAALQRRHIVYEHELVALGVQVQQIQESAATLIVAYSGEKAREIQNHEMEVVNAWRNLQLRVEGRRQQLSDSTDLHRFFSMARDLLNWMSDLSRQMTSSEKPRDVSGVELLMNNHQSLKAEIDARAENFTICVNLGKDLIARRHLRSNEVREKLTQLATQRGGIMEQWEDRWEYLQLILEVYQFARDAAVAESWLMAHEPYVHNEDFGDTLAAVEMLLKKHEAFERSAATQEERFLALERLTTLELRERRRQQQAELPERRRINYVEHYLEQFVPPPPPEPVHVPQPEPVRQRPPSPIVEHVVAQQEAQATQSAVSASVEVEGGHSGILIRKHQWESTTKKASNRGWDKLFVILSNKTLAFYKDQKHAKADPKSYYRHEQPIDLEGASAAVATDYVKRPHVFRIKLANGGDFLFQCKDEDEMNGWMSKVNAAGSTTGELPSPQRSQTLPTSAEGPRSEEPKKRGFFTLGKKKEKET